MKTILLAIAVCTCLNSFSQTIYYKGVNTIERLADTKLIVWDVKKQKDADAYVVLRGTGRSLKIINTVDSGMYTIQIIQDMIGSRTITNWPDFVRWPSKKVVLSKKPDALDYVTFYYYGRICYASYSLSLD